MSARNRVNKNSNQRNHPVCTTSVLNYQTKYTHTVLYSHRSRQGQYFSISNEEKTQFLVYFDRFLHKFNRLQSANLTRQRFCCCYDTTFNAQL